MVTEREDSHKSSVVWCQKEFSSDLKAAARIPFSLWLQLLP